jgi:hypothetical protein
MELYTCPICFKYFDKNINIDKYYHKCNVIEKSKKGDIDYLCIALELSEKYTCHYCRAFCDDVDVFFEHIDKCRKRCEDNKNSEKKIKELSHELKKNMDQLSKLGDMRDKIIEKKDKMLSKYLVKNVKMFDTNNIIDFCEIIDKYVLNNIFCTEKYPLFGLIRLMHCNRYVPEFMNMYYDAVDNCIYVFKNNRWENHDVRTFLTKIVCMYFPVLLRIMKEYEFSISKKDIMDLCITKHKMLHEETQMNEFIEGIKVILSTNKKILEKTRKLWEARY